jgi:hypothetical protein
MSTEYFIPTGNPQPNSPGASNQIRSEFALVQAGFAKLPAMMANGNKAVVVNSAGTALTTTTTFTGFTLNTPTINGGTGTFNSPTLTTPTITGGTINGAVIGATTPAAATFTTATATSFVGNLTGNASTATTALTANTANSATTATTATNVNGGTVNATTGTFSGTVTAPNFVGVISDATNAQFAVTQPLADNSTRIATTAFVMQIAFQNALPDVDNTVAGYVPTNDGTNSFWSPLKTIGGQTLLGTGEVAGVVTATGTDTLTDKTIEDGIFSNGYREETFTANSGTAFTVDILNGSLQVITLTGNVMFTFPTPTAGRGLVILLKQDATGGRTATWPMTVKWPGGTAPTITSAANKLDKFAFVADGINWYGTNAGQNYTV